MSELPGPVPADAAAGQGDPPAEHNALATAVNAVIAYLSSKALRIIGGGVQVTDAAASIDFTGSGVTTTAVGDAVTVNISGGGSGSVVDANATQKGVLRLAGDLGGTAISPTVPALADRVDVTTNQTIDGAKTFTSPVGVADPTDGTHAVNRFYLEEELANLQPAGFEAVYVAAGDDGDLAAALASAPATAQVVAVRIAGT